MQTCNITLHKKEKTNRDQFYDDLETTPEKSGIIIPRYTWKLFEITGDSKSEIENLKWVKINQNNYKCILDDGSYYIMKSNT